MFEVVLVMEESCFSCKYWGVNMPKHLQGHNEACMRFPPVLDTVYLASREDEESLDDDIFWVRPLVDSDDWCGEFKAE